MTTVRARGGVGPSMIRPLGTRTERVPTSPVAYPSTAMTDARPDEQHLSHSVADTEAVAGRLSGTLRGGDVVALHGDLGAGKTQFVRGLVRGLGGSPRAVSSPTFVLLHVYELPRGAHPAAITRVYHLDAYRVHGADDFAAIGFNELLEQDDAIVVVEWPERVAELLPGDRTVHVTIAPEAPDADASADDAGDPAAATTTRRITLQRPL